METFLVSLSCSETGTSPVADVAHQEERTIEQLWSSYKKLVSPLLCRPAGGVTNGRKGHRPRTSDEAQGSVGDLLLALLLNSSSARSCFS